MSKPGRNDPCYCGSGLKYKKCHMKEDQAAERERRAWLEAARFLRRDLLRFARDERFAMEFGRALPFFWDDLYDVTTAEEMSQEEALRFFDWFVFDYQPEEGPRLLELYRQEEWADLSSHQQRTLAGWLEAGPFTAYELLGYEGQTLHLREFITGEEIEVYEPSGHGNVAVGELILTRLVPVSDHLEFGTTAAYLPAAEITDLAEKLAAAKEADAEAYPDASHEQFMRRNNHILVHHALAEARNQGRPPVARLNPGRDDKATQAMINRIKNMQRRK